MRKTSADRGKFLQQIVHGCDTIWPLGAAAMGHFLVGISRDVFNILVAVRQRSILNIAMVPVHNDFLFITIYWLSHTYIHLFIPNPEGSMIHQYYKRSLKNAIQFTIETLLWHATLNDLTPLPQVVAARCPDSH